MNGRPVGTPLGMPALIAGLRAWTHSHDAPVRAAVELLIGHETWLHRAGFRSACVHRDADGEVWVDWRAAREAFDAGVFDAGVFDGASSTELAVLDLAIALGTDRYRLRAMGAANNRLIATAVTTATGAARAAGAVGRGGGAR